MRDLFHDKVSERFIRRVFDVMADTPQHTYQVLTKRSKRLAQRAPTLPWPPNVWMGVSVENQNYAFRADHVREVHPEGEWSFPGRSHLGRDARAAGGCDRLAERGGPDLGGLDS
jgi:hypothetical protein